MRPHFWKEIVFWRLNVSTKQFEKATLAGGCFWCTEAIYEKVKGINLVESGYIGGDVVNPSYELVCSGTTGHAEAVQITYDPSIISYDEILKIFFATHDPTTLNRQGADIGTQYRSAIFWHTKEQEKSATDIVLELVKSNIWTDPIVTEIVPLSPFFKAEDYHQGYYRENSAQMYCQVVITPKMEKFSIEYKDYLKEDM
ncbi:MAG: peptide-methionine (S)-S-oxide reductase MsrA [SAR202 cluster bacterium]|nr:peptide-methionine (S)-S-oxide reductase MsrA [SAR202 cluster bacterium]